MKTKHIYQGIEILHPSPGHDWVVTETRILGAGKEMTMEYHFISLREAQQFIHTFEGHYTYYQGAF